MSEATASIVRPATVDEKKDFIELNGKQNPLMKFFADVADKQQEYVKLHKPFCARCARLDFEDIIVTSRKESSRKVLGKYDEETLRVSMPNLNDYAKTSRFKLVDTDTVFEDKLLDGIRASVEVGTKETFKCVKRGCGITVFIPKKEVNKK